MKAQLDHDRLAIGWISLSPHDVEHPGEADPDIGRHAGYVRGPDGNMGRGLCPPGLIDQWLDVEEADRLSRLEAPNTQEFARWERDLFAPCDRRTNERDDCE